MTQMIYKKHIRQAQRRENKMIENGLSNITALYCRLSRDDGQDSESNSIANQVVI